MRIKRFNGVALSILLVTLLIAIPSFIIIVTSQTASASSSSENFTIVVLPDTQYYSQSYPGIFENQTKWIVQNENVLNIVYVAHLGDIVNTSSQDYQWRNADNAMSILDGVVPYGILPGNHDGYANYEKYFPAARYEGYSYWGGSYDSPQSTGGSSLSPNMNNYQLFTWARMDFITLNLQYNPPSDVLTWADNVLSEYSNRRAIISTHSYLNLNGSLTSDGGTNIYKDVVVPENNVFLVLCGHIHGEAENTYNAGDRTVYQLLSDYQDWSSGGNGYLRIMKFVPSENKIYVKTYSPYLDQYDNDFGSQFELYYPMSVSLTEVSGFPIWAVIVVILIICVAGGLVFAWKRGLIPT